MRSTSSVTRPRDARDARLSTGAVRQQRQTHKMTMTTRMAPPTPAPMAINSVVLDPLESGEGVGVGEGEGEGLAVADTTASVTSTSVPDTEGISSDRNCCTESLSRKRESRSSVDPPGGVTTTKLKLIWRRVSLLIEIKEMSTNSGSTLAARARAFRMFCKISNSLRVSSSKVKLS